MRGSHMASKTYFPAIVGKKRDSGYSVTFPDSPGCVGTGSTLDEAVLSAHEALAGHVARMAADSAVLPEPTPLEALAGRRKAPVAAIALVPVTLPGKALRVSISMSEALLNEIDAVADNRSRFLAEAARAKLARRRSG